MNRRPMTSRQAAMLASGAAQAARAAGIRSATKVLAAVQRIRALHSAVDYLGQTICGHCSAYDGTSSCDNPPVPHPCPTIQTLDEPKDETQ